MMGCMVALGVVSLWYIGKAAIDAFCFNDREGAKRSLFIWLCNAGGIGLALCVSFLIDYLG